MRQLCGVFGQRDGTDRSVDVASPADAFHYVPNADFLAQPSPTGDLMQKIQGNRFQCDIGETVTITFSPSDEGILRVLYRERIEDDFADVGDDFKLERKLGTEQVNIRVMFVFFPGTNGDCRIMLEGSNGGKFENKPPAIDHPGLPEHRTYRFLPK
jgi:hypothetical protein